MFGVRARAAARRRGLGGRDSSPRFGTHNSTHVDAPWHYNSTIAGEPRADDRRAAARVVLRARRRARLHRQGRRRGDRRRRRRGASSRASATSWRQLDIVLVRTGRDAFYGELDYMAPRPGRHRRGDALALRPRRARDGHRRLGLGRPLHLQAAGGARRDEPGVFWAAHQADLPYSQIERLANLGALPPTGFTVACFPLRIVGGSAAPARVVAILGRPSVRSSQRERAPIPRAVFW